MESAASRRMDSGKDRRGGADSGSLLTGAGLDRCGLAMVMMDSNLLRKSPSKPPSAGAEGDLLPMDCEDVGRECGDAGGFLAESTSVSDR